MVTHSDVSRADVDAALAVMSGVLGPARVATAKYVSEARTA
jgi:hypothetical protein